MNTKKVSSFLFYLLPIFLVSLFVFWSSFKLALTGDDYLGLWRINLHFNGKMGGNWNYFTYFLTDYGPMDTFTYTIHKLFGFQDWVYYTLAYIFRLCAAFSFIPLVYLLTKNKIASLMSALFFATTLTGVEANDWSFNMPSFVAIVFLNLFLVFFLKYIDQKKSFYLIISFLFFTLAILFQPIRMAFLPFFLVALSGIYYFFHKSLKKSSILIFCSIFIFYLIIGFTRIGETFGLSGNIGDRLSLKVLGANTSNVGVLKNELENKNFKILLYPVSQLGKVVFPYSFFPRSLEVASDPELILLLTVLITIAFTLLLRHMFKKTFWLFFIPSFSWNFLVWLLFISDGRKQMGIGTFFGFVFGGFFLLFFLSTILDQTLEKKMKLATISTLPLIFLSFIFFWMRNPGFIHETTSRYLIVPASGFAVFLGLTVHIFKKKSLYLASIILLIFINAREVRKYFDHLAVVRDAGKVKKIRDAIPYNPKLTNIDKPILYYLEGYNPEMLYHSIMFGFPIFMAFKNDLDNPFAIASTDNWEEVVSSYKDGEALKRFGVVKIEPVELDNVYSLRIEGDNLIDTSESTRARLWQISQEE